VKLTIASPYNARCGVAIYTEALVAAMLQQDPALTIDVWSELHAPLRTLDYTPPPGVTLTPRWTRGKTFGSVDLKGQTALLIEHEFGFWFDAKPVLDLLTQAKDQGVRTIVCLHSPVPAGLMFKPLFEGLKTHADAVVTLGEKGAEYTRAWGLDPAKVRYIPHGVFDCKQYTRPDAFVLLRKNGIQVFDDPKRPVVLAFGFISAVKNLGDLIDAAVAVKGRCQIVICGGVPERELGAYSYAAALRQAIVAENLSETIKIYDSFVPDAIRDALHSVATAAVFTRKADSESGAIVTALHYGLAIVMRRGGASILGAGDALTFASVEELKTCLDHVLTSADARDLLSQRSRVLRDTFTWARAAQAHLEVIRG